MIKKLIVFTVALCFLVSPVYVFAEEKILPCQTKTSAAFNKKKDIAERKMKDIETLVAKIVKMKQVAKGAIEELDKLMNESVKAYDNAVKQSIEDAKEAEDSKGEKGSTKSIVEFEKMAKSHEKRAQSVGTKMEKIERQIKNGDVELDESLLKSMTDPERKEYMENMTKRGQEKMKKKYPELFAGISVDTKPKLFGLEDIGNSANELCRSASVTVSELLGNIPETVGDLLVPPAEAVITATAAAACYSSAGAACFLAVAAAAYAIQQNADTLEKCLAGQCGCRAWRPGCCFGRRGCWVAYYARGA